MNPGVPLPVDPDGPVVDGTFALYAGALAQHGSPEQAWTLVVAALLQDARMVFY